MKYSLVNYPIAEGTLSPFVFNVMFITEFVARTKPWDLAALVKLCKISLVELLRLSTSKPLPQTCIKY